MATTITESSTKEEWKKVAQQLRVDSIRSSTEAGSGHPSSSLSAADLIAVLISRHLRYDWQDPKNAANDHLIFSKGHASPLVYAMFKATGAISDEEMMAFRRVGSRTEGHPTPILPWVDVATGSLGQGLPIAVGVALAAKYLDELPYRTYVIHGDSEMAEGSVWEGFDKASYYKLDNLCVVLDMNRLGQRGETDLGWNAEAYAARARAFGWHAISIDGHDVDAIDRAYAEAAATKGKPTIIIGKTKKGAGVSFIADKDAWHGKALPPDDAKKAIAELGGPSDLRVTGPKPEKKAPKSRTTSGTPELPAYKLGSTMATRQAYGEALRALGAVRGDIVAVDGEVSNSTFADIFAKAYPDRFFEMFIAEQQMVAAAVGLQVRGYKAYASTFAAFFSRAFDFARMAAISRADLRLVGSHCGVSIGEDGPSQMGLEDIATFRAISGSTVLYPSDANQAAALTAAMADLKGISYLRTTREKTAVLYAPGESFPVGGSRVLSRSDADRVTVVAAGITLHESLAASKTLAAEGIAIRLIDAYSVKPIDAATLREAVRATGGRLVVVEDHWPEGGLGEAVLAALSERHDASGAPQALHLEHLAPRRMPGSGKPAEMLAQAGIDAASIVAAVKRLAAR